jgi:hypothetical protein
MRFLQGNKFDIRKTENNIENTNAWRLRTTPVLLTPEMEDFLRLGVIYISGRDK